MAEIFDLVPKNKFDTSGIETLRGLDDEEIAPVLPYLLEWIQDLNWPVAAEVIPVLAMHSTALLPHIRRVLSRDETDGMWKYWVVTALLPRFPNADIAVLADVLERIAGEPTADEAEAEADIAAGELLNERIRKTSN